MNITPFDFKHLNDIADLEKQCFSLPWTREMFEGELMSSIAEYFVAEYDGRAVGYAGMWKILDEGHITNIAVSPYYRRKKIGQALLDSLVSRANQKGIKKLLLEVRKSNEAAISLYSKNGFQSVGLRKGYYSDNNEDAVLMNLILRNH